MGIGAFLSPERLPRPPRSSPAPRRSRRPGPDARFRSMARIGVRFESGEPEGVIEFDPRKAPFQHDGKPGSILDVLLAHGIALEHACGGNCACTTCHVVVKQGLERLSASEEEEDDLLDK